MGNCNLNKCCKASDELEALVGNNLYPESIVTVNMNFEGH